MANKNLKKKKIIIKRYLTFLIGNRGFQYNVGKKYAPNRAN